MSGSYMLRHVNKPKVSVCVITYNQKNYIRHCLQSIVDQETDFDFEVIVGDDCSTDGTRSIVQEFAERYPSLIRPIFQNLNTGGMANYLSVHRAASGEYVCHVDGDDWIYPGKLTKQKKYLDLHKDCTLVAHRMSVWDNCKQTSITRACPERISLQLLLRKHPIFLHSSIMYRRDKLNDIYFLDDTFIDFYVYVAAALRGDIGFINEEFGGYRRNIGLSRKRKSMPYIQGALDLAAFKIGETKEISRCRSKQYLSYAIASLLDNDMEDFRDFISSAIKKDKSWYLPVMILWAGNFPNLLKSLIFVYKKIVI